MTLLVYLLKVIAVSAILYGYYRLFLRNKRFHHYNRFFLLSALLLSIVLPFIRIPLLYQPDNPVNDAVYRTVSVINTDYVEETIVVPVEESMFTLVNSIYLLYAVGVLFLMTLVVKSLLYIRSLRKRYPAEEITSLKFYNTREPGTPFSFFRSVFWNDQLAFNSHEGQQIFRHELFHVQHKHSADRLLAEVLTALFWFNPFFHLIKKELKAIHEFLADQFAISGNDRYAYATLLVQQALDSSRHTVTNHFFQNHIKRRIAMITQFKQSKYGYWSRVMALPLSLLLFFCVTLYAKKPSPPINANKENAIGEHQPFNQANNVLTGVTDTIPGEEKIEKEKLLKIKMEQLKLAEEQKQKMVEQEMLMKKMQRQELDVLKKQLMEREMLAQENESNKKEHEAEMQDIKRELRERQQEMQMLQKAQLDEIEKIKKEYEQSAGGNEQAKKIYNEKLEEAKKEILVMQEKMKRQMLMEEEMMKNKIHEMEQKSRGKLNEEKIKYDELKKIKQKIIEQENELKKKHQEKIDLQKEELQKREREIKDLENELKREKKETSKIPRIEDSLLTKVARHYLRNLRYPNAAIEKSAEGAVYFSILVDKNGAFSNFVIYDSRPKDKPVKDVVIVGYPKTISEWEEQLKDSEKEAIFKGEVSRATAFRQQKPVEHPEERQYYFKAIFKIAGTKEKPLTYMDGPTKYEASYAFNAKYEGASSSSSSSFSSSSSSSSSIDQDTIPAKRAAKPRAAVRAKPARVAEAKPRSERLFRKESVKRIEFKTRKVEQKNKQSIFKSEKNERKLFVDKKPKDTKQKPKMPSKPKIKNKPLKDDGGGQICRQESGDDNYSTISVSSDK